jgi:hypothetical protein
MNKELDRLLASAMHPERALLESGPVLERIHADRVEDYLLLVAANCYPDFGKSETGSIDQ